VLIKFKLKQVLRKN